jgi:quercetin dioxygenase-like cupin family protein
MEIRRFGIGHRRPDGPPGTRGVSGSVIESSPRGTIAELAFARGATVQPHANPNHTWLVVIEGGGFVRVGDEQTRVGPGDAVHWPPGEIHAAWTDLAEMRAIVVEFGAADPTTIAGLLEGAAREVDDAAADGGTGTADGELVRDRVPTYDPSHGEPV